MKSSIGLPITLLILAAGFTAAYLRTPFTHLSEPQASASENVDSFSASAGRGLGQTDSDSWRTVDMGRVAFRLPPNMQLQNTMGDGRAQAFRAEFMNEDFYIAFALGKSGSCPSRTDIKELGPIKESSATIGGRPAKLWIQNSKSSIRLTVCVPKIGNGKDGLSISAGCSDCKAQERTSNAIDKILSSISFPKTSR